MQSRSTSGADRNELPRAGLLSRVTIGQALDLLQTCYGIDDRDMAFAVLRHTSQEHNVKLREVASAFVLADRFHGARIKPTRAKTGRNQTDPPALSFYARNVHGSRGPGRSEVLQALMRATQARTGAPNMTVQAGDCLLGGLRIEARRGFDCPFLNFFSYVDAGDNSACANALARGRPVVVEDAVCAVVSAHYRGVGVAQTDETLVAVGRQARECAGWLRWHDSVVMPTVMTAVH
uniref:ANTAR domain-containing protein n=1 Tax=Mycobacterium sp. HUMS_1102779 TaxID=3383487 RepID=UPI0038999022